MIKYLLSNQGLLQTTIMIVAISILGIGTALASSCPPELKDRTSFDFNIYH